MHAIEVGAGEPVPPLSGFDGVVSLGGPMSAGDEHPGLAAERALLVEAAERGVPVLGVCLGAQLLAHAFGGAIFPNPSGRTVGVSDVFLTPAGRRDPLFGGLPEQFPVMQWHGDAFELPGGATLLATAPTSDNQAFRVGDRAYGVLFHPEVLAREAHDWLDRDEYRDYAAGAGTRPDAIVDGLGRLGDAGTRLFENWLALV